MQVSFIVPARNKARYVAACARSVLAQTYHPMEIVFSDQGSTDETLAILKDLANGYDSSRAGPNRVRVLECPDTELKGMPGLNAHLNWLDTQIQGDVVVMCSADDLNHPERVAKTVRAFEEFNPSYVNTGVRYLDAEGREEGVTTFPEHATRWLRPEETIRHQIGSSGSSAWARDLFQKHGPLIGCEQQDMILPMMALLERGIYYVDEPLHTYIHHASLDNTGFQGQIKAAETEEYRAQLVELNNFINVRNWSSILYRWQQHPGFLEKISGDPGAVDALMEKVAQCSQAWSAVRETMILNRIAPIQFTI